MLNPKAESVSLRPTDAERVRSLWQVGGLLGLEASTFERVSCLQLPLPPGATQRTGRARAQKGLRSPEHRAPGLASQVGAGTSLTRRPRPSTAGWTAARGPWYHLR